MKNISLISVLVMSIVPLPGQVDIDKFVPLRDIMGADFRMMVFGQEAVAELRDVGMVLINTSEFGYKAEFRSKMANPGNFRIIIGNYFKEIDKPIQNTLVFYIVRNSEIRRVECGRLGDLPEDIILEAGDVVLLSLYS